MFGYVIPDKPNILVKDYELYRAYYCGMCKAIGDRSGQLMRFTINYDVTLLAMFAVNLMDTKVTVNQEKCLTHWIGKRSIAHCDEAFSIVADINSILGYYKASDDAVDEKSLLKKTAKGVFRPYYKSAKKRLPQFDQVCKKEYERLAQLEKDGTATIDQYADTFANILVAAGREVGRDEHFETLCYNLGRWIYIIDALDDLSDDYTHKRFNPFLVGNTEPLSKEKYQSIIDQGIGILNVTINEIKSAYNKMDIKVAEGPLSNIIYLGLDARTQDILRGGKNGKKPV